MILAGIDEAGYGPLLGPLVVSATAFDVPCDLPPGEIPTDVQQLPCCWKLLKGAVAKKSPVKNGRIIVADSKVVHHLTDGVKHLERGVLTMLATLAQEQVRTASQLLPLLGCAVEALDRHPWYAAYDPPIPWLCDPNDLAITQNMVRGAMERSAVRLVAMRTHLISEQHFNRLVQGTNNKASALVSITLSHLHYLHSKFGQRGLVVAIDKQGGRDNYTGLLLRTFPDANLKVLMESDAGSSYLLTEQTDPQYRRTVVHFREKGESHFMSVALSSMVCKYLRELYMHAFNRWWCQQIDGLRPTAGYYQDGTRWILDVEPHLARLKIERSAIVRVR